MKETHMVGIYPTIVQRLVEFYMDMKEETVTITKEEYESLKRAADWLLCLEGAGVDNWDGISYAYEEFEQLGYSEDD